MNEDSQKRRQPKRSSVKFEVNTSGMNYATMAHDGVTINHPKKLTGIPNTEKLARMYETTNKYGYRALKFHQSKLTTECDSFANRQERSGIIKIKFGTRPDQLV